MKYRIALIKGDGIGPEIIDSAVAVLDETADRLGLTIIYDECAAGGQAIELYGNPLPAETVRICKRSDAVLLGAVGAVKWELLPAYMRPERAILGLRTELGLYANLRPIVLHIPLAEASPLRRDITERGFNFVFVR
ncbi:MAG: 3-isopropylmalate dehydrogenase, partial [Clostridiales bacterium]|nr:3-isopropylmalate dehydrogenase [Clostridiales bacterium]